MKITNKVPEGTESAAVFILLVMEGELSAGQLVAFLMYVNMVVQPFRVAGFVISLFQRAAVASDRLFEVLSLSPEIADAPSGQAPTVIRGDIDIRDLSFSYPGMETQALDGINLSTLYCISGLSNSIFTHSMGGLIRNGVGSMPASSSSGSIAA